MVMDYSELLQQVLVSILITALAYCAFPLIYAKTRKAPITKKKYNKLCYGINAILMCVFLVMNGFNLNPAPYILWTSIFSYVGTKILSRRGVMADGDYMKDDPNRLTECISCGYRDEKFFTSCPKCGKNAKRYVYLNEEPAAEADKICFCRKCGEKLVDNSSFCGKCGTEIIKENQQ